MSGHISTRADAVIEALRDVMPHLRTSHDVIEAAPAIMRTQAMALREQAERIERQDAAIFRLRRALADYDAAEETG